MNGAKKAVWNDQILAESDRTIVIEGYHYFPAEDVQRQFLQNNPKQTFCPWKGTASYFDVVVDGKTNSDAAWHYPDPKPDAMQIKGHVAFWHGVKVVDSQNGSAS